MVKFDAAERLGMKDGVKIEAFMVCLSFKANGMRKTCPCGAQRVVVAHASSTAVCRIRVKRLPPARSTHNIHSYYFK